MLARIGFLFVLGAVLAATISSCDSDNPAQSRTIDTLVTLNFIRDFEYADGRIYDLGLSGEFTAGDSILNLLVFEARPFANPAEAASMKVARFHTYPLGVLDTLDLTYRVEQIGLEHYECYDNAQENEPYIVLDSTHATYALGIWCVLKRGSEIDTVGELGDGLNDTLQLRMLRPNGNNNPWHPTWPLMWRNVYKIPRGEDPEDLKINVFRGPIGAEGTVAAVDYQAGFGGTTTPYLRILGLDQYNRMDVKLPDGIVDYIPSVFAQGWGLLIFPNRTPFDSDTTYIAEDGLVTPPLIELNARLYTYATQAERRSNSIYFIQYQETYFVPR